MNKKERKDFAERMQAQADAKAAKGERAGLKAKKRTLSDKSIVSYIRGAAFEYMHQPLHRFTNFDNGGYPEIKITHRPINDYGSYLASIGEGQPENHRTSQPVYTKTVQIAPVTDADREFFDKFMDQGLEQRRRDYHSDLDGSAYVNPWDPMPYEQFRANFLSSVSEDVIQAQYKIYLMEFQVQHGKPAHGPWAPLPYEAFKANYHEAAPEGVIKTQYEAYRQQFLHNQPTYANKPPHFQNLWGAEFSFAGINSIHGFLGAVQDMEESQDLDADAAYQAELERKMQDDNT